ncbi:sec-independent periplasmic protein translocase TatC [Candidatus Nitrosoglobus terrae]|uniref:Sec-independent protein translocase protein TatC n=1 Tax=Candidatus Nitrosoglobus terrae TaxID=1630141 RepID=A0A1Q2SJV0_9GAMM|nr:twin-arginine translocase subunit TatC [Candidatus Nitrosoglobus terrae]BAW79403.1 sec-independent periplasmic protein translocase TatC [Candidatus Nitrosoglobus terrae]
MATPDHSDKDELPLIRHLIELRSRLLRSIITIFIITLTLLPFSNDLYHILALPLMAHLPAATSMIATEVTAPFLAPLKLTLAIAIALSIPMLLYQLWSFVAPGLYKNERRLILPLLISSTFLFFLGIAFAYLVVFPLMFGFFTQAAPKDIAVMTDISKYLDFVLTMFFAFGIAFEVPVATVLLVWTGVSNVENLQEKRPYIIVIAFIVGMLLTPPDVISQTLLAVPMWLLFEAGLWFSRLFVPKSSK